MVKKTHRIFFTILAIGLGILVVVVLSFIGGRSRGPLEGFFSEAGSVVQDVESKVMIQQRIHKRSDHLDWFGKYKADIRQMKNPQILLLGTYDNQTKESFEPIIDFEDSLHTTFSLIHIYTAWGTKTEEQFPGK
ncbi:MAG: hypothetical protein NTX61_02800 [Bacteroidetes bacterium]|nr:hypothetical protein [Bacteroidota bacterium]